MTTYLARVEPGLVCVYRLDPTGEVLVATIPLPDRVSLRPALLAAGWQPTGRKARGGWGAIFVTPADDGPHPI